MSDLKKATRDYLEMIEPSRLRTTISKLVFFGDQQLTREEMEEIGLLLMWIEKVDRYGVPPPGG